ncbi:MAG: patatin-like phospholipase family protein [Candidatus Obscuribacterales bacterium]|nr:patatin-like phospholipase family protein [Candidatus Obscuribacterales bacterium]
MTKGNLGRIVRASCSIPPLLRPVELDGMVLADCGIRANLPTYAARDLGADVVIAVNVDELLKEVDKDEFKNVTGLANRVASVILAARDELHSKEAVLVLHPDMSGISIVSVEDADYA